MKKFFHHTAFIALSLLAQTVFADDQIFNLTTRLGSTLEAHVAPDKSVTGYFTSALALKKCAINGVRKSITGYVSGDNNITFSVSYPECGWVVNLTGYMNTDMQSLDNLAVTITQSLTAV